MNIIGLGKTNLTYYFKNDLLIGYNPSGVVLDTLLYLSEYHDTRLIGNLGTDSIKILNKTRINLKDIHITKENKMFVTDKISNRCPLCDRVHNNVYDYKNYILNDEDILITDNIDLKGILLLNNIQDIDLLSLEELIKNLRKFNVVILSLNVYHFIKDRYMIDAEDLDEALDISILAIYRGVVGIDLYIDHIKYEKEFEDKINIIDMNSAFSSVASVVIKYYLLNLYHNDRDISKLFIESFVNFSKCVSKVGNSYLLPINKDINYSICLCE